jgi:hypothetical protein
MLVKQRLGPDQHAQYLRFDPAVLQTRFGPRWVRRSWHVRPVTGEGTCFGDQIIIASSTGRERGGGGVGKHAGGFPRRSAYTTLDPVGTERHFCRTDGWRANARLIPTAFELSMSTLYTSPCGSGEFTNKLQKHTLTGPPLHALTFHHMVDLPDTLPSPRFRPILETSGVVSVVALVYTGRELNSIYFGS